MPRRPMTAAQRKAVSLRMKASWKRRKANTRQVFHIQDPPPVNGLIVIESRIILTMPPDHEVTLTVDQARHLYQSLSETLRLTIGAAHPDPEPTHE